MFKFFSLIVISSSFAYAEGSQQMMVVLSDELNATVASMQRYEYNKRWVKTGESIPVTLGRSGLGYALIKEPLKNEGDGRSPAGLFDISATFGYDVSSNSAMPYYRADEKLICVDDVNDTRYNTITISEENRLPASYEKMRREDGLYRNGIVINYNASKTKGRGSCIFIHLNHSDHRPTSGCTAMDEDALNTLLGWLDPQKHPQILQIPKSDCGEYQKKFEGIECR